jgi:hypothetical protein
MARVAARGRTAVVSSPGGGGRLRLGKGLRFYQTPPFKARYNEVVASGSVQARAREGVALRLTLIGLGLAVISLAGYGYYVLNYIAK